MDKDEQLLTWATRAAVAVAAGLLLLKAAAYMVTDSVAILSSLIDSMLDMAASAINLYAVKQAMAPPDAEHRFGHGKAEPLAGMAQAAFISGSALFLLFEAVRRLLAPQAVNHSSLGITVMLITIVATLLLVSFQKYVVRKTGSVAIDADSLHYSGDLVMNSAVIVALLLDTSAFPLADPIIAIVIACWIAWMAWRIGIKALDQLMDHELPEQDRDNIVAIVQQQEGCLGLHDLRTRRAGRDVFIQLHLDLDGKLPLHEAHHIAEAVEAAIQAAYPKAEILIHQDPVTVLHETHVVTAPPSSGVIS